MTQINVTKMEQKFSLTEKAAMAFCANFDGKDVVWRKIDGCFLIPYKSTYDLLDPSKHYYCDDVIEADGKIQPQMYSWRRWCHVAADFLNYAKDYNLDFVSIHDVTAPAQTYQMEISVPVKEQEVIPKFSKEATDV